MIVQTLINPTILKTEFVVYFLHYFSLLSVNLLSYSYIFCKFFKFICYGKLTLEWFPMVNPYLWPYSALDVFCGWYFDLWERMLPPIRMEKGVFDASTILAIESLSSIVYFLVRFTNDFLKILEYTDKTITTKDFISLF
uniref:Photosystem I assembly protein Ycf19 n=1 Tax=Neotessella volvocina TaxID=52559 RepID=A0A3G2QZT7_9STRA|nr:photosystem I assembly protein Ycf19 [Neotessella volvocina]